MTLSSDASSMLTITLTEKPQHEGASANIQPDPFSTSRFKNSGDDYFFGAIR